SHSPKELNKNAHNDDIHSGKAERENTFSTVRNPPQPTQQHSECCSPCPARNETFDYHLSSKLCEHKKE
ncbi:hypothetical protein Ancab_021821, partial [Ancistrocladus abbreviatus]